MSSIGLSISIYFVVSFFEVSCSMKSSTTGPKLTGLSVFWKWNGSCSSSAVCSGMVTTLRFYKAVSCIKYSGKLSLGLLLLLGESALELLLKLLSLVPGITGYFDGMDC